MATLDEVLVQLRAKAGYIHDVNQGPSTGPERVYTFWFSLDSDYPNDIDHYAVRILVMNEGQPEPDGEEAIVYTTKHIEQISYAFRDALVTTITTFLQGDEKYDKATTTTLNETQEYATGLAVKTDAGITTIVEWVGYIPEGEGDVILRLVS